MKRHNIFPLLGVFLACSLMAHCNACGNPSKPDINRPNQENNQAYLDALQKAEKIMVASINLTYRSTSTPIKTLEVWVAELKKGALTTLDDKIKAWHAFEKKLKLVEENRKAIEQKHEEDVKKAQLALDKVQAQLRQMEAQQADREDWKKSSLDLIDQLAQLIKESSKIQGIDQEFLKQVMALAPDEALNSPNQSVVSAWFCTNLIKLYKETLPNLISKTSCKEQIFFQNPRSLQAGLEQSLLQALDKLGKLLQGNQDDLASSLQALEPGLKQAIAAQTADFDKKIAELAPTIASLKAQEAALKQDLLSLNTAYQDVKLNELATINQDIQHQLGIGISLQNFDQLPGFYKDLTELYENIRKQVETKK